MNDAEAGTWAERQIEQGRQIIEGWTPERRAEMAEFAAERPDLMGPELAAAFGLIPATVAPTPDPRVVAWMRAYRRQYPHMLNDVHTKAGVVNRYHREFPGVTALREVMAAYDEAWRPLTLADIPAGQGAASLYLKTLPDGVCALMYRGTAGDAVLLDYCLTDPGPGDAAKWEHLAATLPTMEETP